MSLRRAGLGRYAPERNSVRRPSRKHSSPTLCWMCFTVIPSIPAERLPLFEATRRQEWRIMRRSVSHPPQVPPCFVRMCLTLLIELALNAEYPGLFRLVIRVHRSLLRSANLPSSSCFPSPCARLSRAPTTTEAPPSVSSISDHRG
jgi:hypothetical protein